MNILSNQQPTTLLNLHAAKSGNLCKSTIRENQEYRGIRELQITSKDVNWHYTRARITPFIHQQNAKMVHKKRRQKNKNSASKGKQSQLPVADVQLILKEIAKLNNRMSSIQGQVQKLDNRMTDIIDWIRYGEEDRSITSSRTNSPHSSKCSTADPMTLIECRSPREGNISYEPDEIYSTASPCTKSVMNRERIITLECTMEDLDWKRNPGNPKKLQLRSSTEKKQNVEQYPYWTTEYNLYLPVE